jgi:hypothetical protein
LPTPELDHGMEPNRTGFGNQQGIREHWCLHQQAGAFDSSIVRSFWEAYF